MTPFTDRYARDHAALGQAAREAGIRLVAARVLMAIADHGGQATRVEITGAMRAAREQVTRELAALRDAGLVVVWVANDGPRRRKLTHAELTSDGWALARRINEATKEQL